MLHVRTWRPPGPVPPGVLAAISLLSAVLTADRGGRRDWGRQQLGDNSLRPRQALPDSGDRRSGAGELQRQRQ